MALRKILNRIFAEQKDVFSGRSGHGLPVFLSPFDLTQESGYNRE